MEVCFKGSLKNLYYIFAAAGSLLKEARRCWYAAKPICDGQPTCRREEMSGVLLRITKTDLNSAAGVVAAQIGVEHQHGHK